MSFQQYRFFVTVSAVETEVFPLNFLKTTIVWSKDRGKSFYRPKFSGSLTFGTHSETTDESGATANRIDDWLLFSGLQITDPYKEIKIVIERDAVFYWQGYFTISDGFIDFDKCTFTVTPLIDDNYTKFDKEGDTKYNVIALSAVSSIMTIAGVTYTYDRCRLLKDVIEYLANGIATATVVSTFFNDATNPVTLNTNHYRYITIAQKSDIKRWQSSDPATVAYITWNELMDMITCMNLSWRYDSITNVVTIEHVSYTGWVSVAGEDLTTQVIARSNNKMSYTKEELPKYEEFAWMEGGNDEFAQHVIWYDSLGVGKDTVKYIWDITTDIQYIQYCMSHIDADLKYDMLSNISDSGWVLFANYLDGTDYRIYMTSRSGGNTYFNADFSWGVLHEALFKHERMLISGYMNYTLKTFYSAVKTIKQSTQMIYCSNFDPSKYLTTELGENYLDGSKGYVENAEISPTGLIKLNLLYGSPENTNTGFVNGKSMVVAEVRSGYSSTWTAVLTEPADANLKLKIRMVIEDSDTPSTSTCDTGYYDLDIIIGALTGSVEIPWCVTGVTPLRVYIRAFDNSGLGSWGYTTVYDFTGDIYS